MKATLSNTQEWLQDRVAPQVWVPLLLFGISLLTFGLFIPRLGFYWDDWVKAWYLHGSGPTGFLEVFADDRPFLGWTYILTTALLGEDPWAWHIFSGIIHWLSAVTVWVLIRSLMPRQEGFAVITSIFFLLYPSFTDHALSLIYSHYFLILTAQLISLCLMVLSIKKQRYYLPLTIASMILAIYGLISIEYFIGLEIIRVVMIWVALYQPGIPAHVSIRKALRYWAPYALIPIGFFIWRSLVVQFPSYTPVLLGRLYRAPLVTIPTLVLTVLGDFVDVLVAPWLRAAGDLNLSIVVRGPFPIQLGIAAGVLILSVFGLSLIRQPSPDPDASRTTVKLGALLGATLLLVAGIPFWITNLPISLDFPFGRFTLPFLLGASLILASIVVFLYNDDRTRIIGIVFFCSLVFLSAARQGRVSAYYVDDWEQQQQTLWQFIWRVPGLKEGTVILFPEPVSTSDDESFSAAINWIYGPGEISGSFPYIVLDYATRIGGTIPQLEEDIEISKSWRHLNFNSSTSEMLVVDLRPGSCLRVLSEDDAFRYNLPEEFKKASYLSHVDNILLTPPREAYIPRFVSRSEPAQDWCFYFQKADLARQAGDWETIATLAQEISEKRLMHKDPSEQWVFIEGFARLGEMDEAVALSQEMLSADPALLPYLCKGWQRVLTTTDAPWTGVDQRLLELGCELE